MEETEEIMPEIYANCFAYVNKGMPRCAVLKGLYSGTDCKGCPFFKTRKQYVKDWLAAEKKNKES